jgi:hypothetical protein
LTLRDIDTRELSVSTPPPGSIGTIVAAHPVYGCYLVEFDAARFVVWRGRTRRHCPKTLPG